MLDDGTIPDDIANSCIPAECDNATIMRHMTFTYHISYEQCQIDGREDAMLNLTATAMSS